MFFSKILTVDGILHPRINVQYVVIFIDIGSSFIVMQTIGRTGGCRRNSPDIVLVNVRARHLPDGIDGSAVMKPG